MLSVAQAENKAVRIIEEHFGQVVNGIDMGSVAQGPNEIGIITAQFHHRRACQCPKRTWLPL